VVNVTNRADVNVRLIALELTLCHLRLSILIQPAGGKLQFRSPGRTGVVGRGSGYPANYAYFA
jgi:hypothetical protein